MSQIIDKPWGQEIILTTTDLPYTGKILKVNAGKRLSLQKHDQKTETLTLLSGIASIQINDQTTSMETNTGITIFPNTPHRLSAITDCQILEVSTPQIGTTFRLEDDYQRGDEIL